MSLRLILIHFIYRIIFGAGIAAIMWVGGQLVYTKTNQWFAMSKFKNRTDVTTDMSGIPFSEQLPVRSGHLRERLTEPERESAVIVLEPVDENSEYSSILATRPSVPLCNPHRKLSNGIGQDPFFREFQDICVGDMIQFSTPRGTFRYFVTTIENTDRLEPRMLTIITSRRFPIAGAIPQ